MGQMISNSGSDSVAQTRVPPWCGRAPWGQVVRGEQESDALGRNRARGYSSSIPEACEITGSDTAWCYWDLGIWLYHQLAGPRGPAMLSDSENSSEIQPAELPATVSQPASRRTDSALSVHPFLLNHCSNLWAQLVWLWTATQINKSHWPCI